MRSALRAAVVFLVCFGLSPSSAKAQGAGAGLLVAGMDLRLGMRRQAVLDSLARAGFHLAKVGNVNAVDSWRIFGKTDGSVEDEGGVTFRDGKLAWISRTWANFAQADAFRLGSELYHALASLSDNATVPVAVMVMPALDAPGIHASRVQFQSGLRTITLLITEGSSDKGGNQVTIQEDVGR